MTTRPRLTFEPLHRNFTYYDGPPYSYSQEITHPDDDAPDRGRTTAQFIIERVRVCYDGGPEWYVLARELYYDPYLEGVRCWWWSSPGLMGHDDAVVFARFALQRWIQTRRFGAAGMHFRDDLDEKGNPIGPEI